MKKAMKAFACGLLSASLVFALAPGAVVAFAQDEEESASESSSEISYEDGRYVIDGLTSSYATLGLPAGIALRTPTVTFDGEMASFTITTSKGQFDRMILKKRTELADDDEGFYGVPIYTDPSNPVYDPVTKTGIDGYTFTFAISKDDFLKGLGVTPASGVDAGIPFALKYRPDYVNNNGESTYANKWSGSKDQYLGFEGLTYAGAALAMGSIDTTPGSFTYNGSAQYPTIAVRNSDGIALTELLDYTVEYPQSSVNAGNYSVTVVGAGAYVGTQTVSYTIAKAKQSVKVTPVKRMLKAKKLKKKKITVKVLTVKGNSGKVTYKKISVNKLGKKFKVNSKNGKVTVAKGVKKGTYKVTIQVNVAKDSNHVAFSKNVKATIKVS